VFHKIRAASPKVARATATEPRHAAPDRQSRCVDDRVNREPPTRNSCFSVESEAGDHLRRARRRYLAVGLVSLTDVSEEEYARSPTGGSLDGRKSAAPPQPRSISVDLVQFLQSGAFLVAWRPIGQRVRLAVGKLAKTFDEANVRAAGIWNR
jgi:hypothetical protein